MYRHRPQLLATTYLLAALWLSLACQANTLVMALTGPSATFSLCGGLGPFGAIVLELAPERSRGAYAGVINAVRQVGGAAARLTVGTLMNATGTFVSGFGCMIAGLCLGAACHQAGDSCRRCSRTCGYLIPATPATRADPNRAARRKHALRPTL